MNKTTLQEIKEIAEDIVATTIHSSKLIKIIALCEKQEVKGKVITNPVEDWTSNDLSNVVGAKLALGVEAMVREIQEILTRPKEKQLFAHWNDDSTVVVFLEIDQSVYDNCLKTTNAQIKEIGVMVEDWQELANRGEL